MTVPARIKKQNIIFSLATVDYAQEISSLVFESEDSDSDFTTFADVLAGGAKTYFFTGTAAVSTDTGSLFNYLWSNPGLTSIAFKYAPWGNATATATKWHITGTCTLPSLPTMGGDAGTTYSFDFRIDIDGTPTKVTS